MNSNVLGVLCVSTANLFDSYMLCSQLYHHNHPLVTDNYQNYILIGIE